MIIENTYTLTVKDYSSKLSSPIKLYCNDKVRLRFILQEYGLVEGSVSSRKLQAINPVNCYITVQTPLGQDDLEVAEINGNQVTFEIDKKYTSCVGVYKAQIHLITNQGYRRSLPEFSFQVKNTINEDLDGNPLEEVKLILDNSGNCLLSSNNEIIVFK